MSGYEKSDLSARGIRLTIAAIALLVVLAALVVTSLSRGTEATAWPPPADVPNKASPGADLQALRERENRLLESYGWISKETGAVRIPVEQAIDLLAERGLPVREMPR